MSLHPERRDQTARKGVNPESSTTSTGHRQKANGRAHANGHAAHHAPAPFDEAADPLTGNGYSALALVRKRPVDDDWTRWCRAAPTPDEIAARKGRGRNIGVAMGFNCIAAVDIDTDDPAINAAIRRVVCESTVAKRGQKGRTDFYRSSRPLQSRRFVGKDGEIIAEVLGDGRQSAIPRSIHPDTRQPYDWLTPATLLNTPAADLPPCSDDLGDLLQKELAPFLAPERKPRPQRSGPPPILTKAMHKRQRAWALRKLDACVKDLADKPKPGRNRAVFDLACSMGRFVHHGIITDAELRLPTLAACDTNGLTKENGRHDCEKTVDNGLRYALADVLEDLKDKPRHPGGHARQQQTVEAHEEPPAEPNREKVNSTCLANEDAIANVFAERHAQELRYCHDWGAWLKWDSSRWERERRKLAFHYARQLAREANVAGKATPAKASTAAGVERFAQADPRLATVNESWDQSPWLLATPDGTVDLRTGTLRSADRADFITKRAAIAPAPPGTQTPIWDAFLQDATRGDGNLIGYLRRMAGYCLTGDVSEHALFFIHGDGGNGKGVFINTLTRILDDCAVVASMDTFTASKSDRHPTDLAMLRGARLVTAQETEEGRAWSEVRIKTLTGGDPITARFMRQDFFTFEPTFKLVIAGNHKPNLRSVDTAMRRRFNIIPFTNKPKKPDLQLAEKLEAEWSGILRWCIDGCLAWQKQGLNPPEVVCSATNAYFDEQDLFARWLDECCEIGPNKSDTHAALFKSWKAWAEANGEPAGSSKDFTPRMLKANPKFEMVKHTPGHHGKRGFKGVGLKPIDASNQWQNQHNR